MSTNQPNCAGQLCGQFKSIIIGRLLINKLCYPNLLSSYQDNNNEIIVFTEKCCLCPPTGKNVLDNFVYDSNPIKINRYGIYWQYIKLVTLILCPHQKKSSIVIIVYLTLNHMVCTFMRQQMTDSKRICCLGRLK